MCYYKNVNIFVLHTCCHNEYKDSYSRIRSERIENTFVDVYFGTFRMLSTDPFFFTELSYFKSVIHTFLNERMGSMSKSDPTSERKFQIGDDYRGTLTFQKTTKNRTVRDKKEPFLFIRHDLPSHVLAKLSPISYSGASSEFDYQEVKMLDLCLGKALNLYDARVVHPENNKELSENWDNRRWTDDIYQFISDENLMALA